MSIFGLQMIGVLGMILVLGILGLFHAYNERYQREQTRLTEAGERRAAFERLVYELRNELRKEPDFHQPR